MKDVKVLNLNKLMDYALGYLVDKNFILEDNKEVLKRKMEMDLGEELFNIKQPCKNLDFVLNIEDDGFSLVTIFDDIYQMRYCEGNSYIVIEQFDKYTLNVKVQNFLTLEMYFAEWDTTDGLEQLNYTLRYFLPIKYKQREDSDPITLEFLAVSDNYDKSDRFDGFYKIDTKIASDDLKLNQISIENLSVFNKSIDSVINKNCINFYIGNFLEKIGNNRIFGQYSTLIKRLNDTNSITYELVLNKITNKLDIRFKTLANYRYGLSFGYITTNLTYRDLEYLSEEEKHQLLEAISGTRDSIRVSSEKPDMELTNDDIQIMWESSGQGERYLNARYEKEVANFRY